MLQREAGVKITHVPFKGAGPAVTDLIGGQINGMFVDLPVISPYVKSGKVRALAVTSVRALAVLSGRADDEGSRLSRRGDDELLRSAGAGEDAARHRHEAARRGREGGRDARPCASG